MFSEYDAHQLIQIKKRLVEHNEELQAGDCDAVVHVVHRDGSSFLFAHADYEQIDNWLLVWTEHNGYFKFHKDDLLLWKGWIA